MSDNGNLRVPTSEEARINGAKGGKASGEARRRKRSMREACEIILAMSLESEEAAKLMDVEDIKSFAEANGKNITVQDAMILKQAQMALMGSHRSFELIRDTAGEKPKERIETNNDTLERLDEVLKEIGGVI